MKPTPDIANEAKKLKQNRPWALEQKQTIVILLSKYINKMISWHGAICIYQGIDHLWSEKLLVDDD